MAAFVAGQIVIVDWRDARPSEANKARPAVVVEDTDVFDESYPNAIVVPLAQHAECSIPALRVMIEPTIENGCASVCYAISHNVTTISKQRIREITSSRISAEQLGAIRRQCAESLGL